MELYDVVDSLNKVVEVDGRLMLNRNIIPHKRFPAYKCFNYTIWKVRSSVDKEKILSLTFNVNTSNLDLVKCQETTDKSFLEELLKWIIERGYNYVDEQVSNRTD